MITVLSIWALVFFLCIIPGCLVLKLIGKTSNQNLKEQGPDLAGYFFCGFLTLSAVAGVLSVFMPIGKPVLISLILFCVIIPVFFFRHLRLIFGEIAGQVKSWKSYEFIILATMLILLLSAATHFITFYDTGLYHVQSIKWTRNFPVINGLGNIHGRLAFNSMFFVISSLFTFQINDVLIFPLNGLCFVVLMMKLYILYKKATANEEAWKVLFYGLLALVSLFILLPDLNSTLPDIICATLIIYLFALLIENTEKREIHVPSHIFLINLLIFSCISFKLSSVFLSLVILLTLNKNMLKRIFISAGVGFIVLSAFFLRNYFLSGYILFPFPAIDIFSVDWKIPLENVFVEKLSIEGWAKIPGMPFEEVDKMKINEWIVPWFKLLNINSIALIIPNVISIFALVFMIRRKDYFLSFIQMIIISGLIFWFLAAPDPRFAYGFLLVGFALSLSYVFKLFEKSKLIFSKKYINIFLSVLFVLVLFQRRDYPLYLIKNPRLFITPDPYETVETVSHSTNFRYRVPVTGDQCFNSEIPCVPYPFENVVLRTNNIRDGFKVIIDKGQPR